MTVATLVAGNVNEGIVTLVVVSGGVCIWRESDTLYMAPFSSELFSHIEVECKNNPLKPKLVLNVI